VNLGLRGNGFGRLRQKAPNCLRSGPSSLAETASRPGAPKNRGVFVKPREISVSAGVRSGGRSVLRTGLGGQIP
jgi:hypothetical protein